jgi:hypothetical protein
MGSNWSHCRWVSSHSFPNCNFRVLFIRSTFSGLWGMYSFQVIPKHLAISYTTSVMKAGPSSNSIDTGILNWRMVSINRHLATSLGFLSLKRESFHLSWEDTDKHQQIFTSSDLWHLSKIHNQIFKRSSSNTLHLGWHSWPLLGIALAHRLHLSHTVLLMLESLET